MMGTTRQTVGSEEPSSIGSGSKSGKVVLIKKRSSKSSSSVNSENDTVICLGSSEQRTLSSEEDRDARIAMRAHELYEQRGGCHGEDQADWFEAERQILATI